MNRKKKLLLNSVTGILKQIIMVICGFILPRFMLLYYGSAVNGVVSSITYFLSFISLLDMGVGAVVQANLYKPLAESDNEGISRIVISSERFFRRLAYIFLGYILVLCVVFPVFVNDSFSPVFSVSLLLIISISTFAQYLFGMTYQLLLNADQKSYVQLSMQIVTITLNTLFAIVLMKLGASVHIVKLMTALVYVLRPLGQLIYVKKHYKIERKIKVVGEPINQKWNGFSQHLAAVVCQNIDVVVLTLFAPLEQVSVYSVYFSVTNGVEQIVLTAATGLESLFGNMIVRKERETLNRTFNAVEWIVHTAVTVLFTITGLCIIPFISVYTRGISDANYIEPLFGALMVIAYGSQCLRVPYFRIIKASGHFKETQNGAYISAGLNIFITIALVFKLGLVGAALGTLVAMLYHTLYFVWYLKKHILSRPISVFIKHIIVDAFVAVISCVVSKFFSFSGESYAILIIYALEVSGIVVLVSVLINLIAYKKDIKDIIKLIKK